MENSTIEHYLEFLQKCKSPYHFIKETELLLDSNLIKKVEKITKNIEPGKYYIVEKNSIFLISIPNNNEKNSAKIIGTHSDSPVLKIKNLNFDSSNGVSKINLEPYGGGLWHTWFDRELKISGMIVDESMKRRIYECESSVVIPSLPPHLNDGEVYKKGFHYSNTFDAITTDTSIKERFEEQKILSHDLMLYNPNSCSYDVNSGMIFSSKQDNISSSFCAIQSFVNLINDKELIIVAVFDYEEIGSLKHSGARTHFLNDILTELEIDKKSSFIISADASHGYNSNYTKHYDSVDKMCLGEGIGIKKSSSYSTDLYTSAYIKNLCKSNNIPYKVIKNSNIIRGGSTIGNMISCQLNIQCIDIGIPIFSMHSCIEISNEKDINSMRKFFDCFMKSGCFFKYNSE